MDVLKLPQLFKGNQLEEIKYWLDNESPFIDEPNWIKKRNHYFKNCYEVDVLHSYLIDIARETFEVHNLLPTVAGIRWYEESPATLEHIDYGPSKYNILFNYYSVEPIVLTHDGLEVVLENEEALAYSGNFPHSRKKTDEISICLSFGYNTPDNPHFALAEYNDRGNYIYKSNKPEVEVNWL